MPSEDIMHAACFVPSSKKFNWKCNYGKNVLYWVQVNLFQLKSGFFPCLLLSAERQALGPLCSCVEEKDQSCHLVAA
jgi:hypothetical protein